MKGLRFQPRIVKVMEHGTAYAYDERELVCCPIMADGRIDSTDLTDFGAVKFSPLSHRPGHEAALRKLGLSEKRITRVLKCVHYDDGAEWESVSSN